MFLSACLFAFVFLFFCFWLLCKLISCLIFMTFSSGNIFCFFYVIIHCWSYLFSFIFMQSQSVCMFTLIFCVGTWLFQPVDYYCLMLLWLQTIPRNKKKMLFPNFLDVRLWVAVTQCMLWCKRQEKTRRGDGDRNHLRRRLFTEP